MSKKVQFIFLMALIIVIFSCITMVEVWLIKILGFDLLAHLQATYKSGQGTKFVFETFGVLAFIVGQPVVFVLLLVLLVKKLMPMVAENLGKLVTSFLGQ